MAGAAARAYDSTASAYAPVRRYANVGSYERVATRPSIEVRTGGKGDTDAALRRVVSVFKLAIAAIAVAAVVGVAVVWLTNASMDVLWQKGEVDSAIEDAETLNTQLEVQYYAAANPTKVKEYAADHLGMSAAAAPTTTVDLTPSVLKDAVSSTVTGGIAACENAQAKAEAEMQAKAQAEAQAQGDAQTASQTQADAAEASGY